MAGARMHAERLPADGGRLAGALLFRPDDRRNGRIAGGEAQRAWRKLADGLPVPLPGSRQRLTAHDLTADDQGPQQFAPPGPAPVTLGEIAVRRAGGHDFGRRASLVVQRAHRPFAPAYGWLAHGVLGDGAELAVRPFPGDEFVDEGCRRHAGAGDQRRADTEAVDRAGGEPGDGVL